LASGIKYYDLEKGTHYIIQFFNNFTNNDPSYVNVAPKNRDMNISILAITDPNDLSGNKCYIRIKPKNIGGPGDPCYLALAPLPSSATDNDIFQFRHGINISTSFSDSTNFGILKRSLILAVKFLPPKEDTTVHYTLDGDVPFDLSELNNGSGGSWTFFDPQPSQNPNNVWNFDFYHSNPISYTSIRTHWPVFSATARVENYDIYGSAHGHNIQDFSFAIFATTISDGRNGQIKDTYDFGIRDYNATHANGLTYSVSSVVARSINFDESMVFYK
jgi:hypothetical protein